MRQLLTLLTAGALFAACASDKQKAAEAWLEEATAAYEQADFDKATALIDSIRTAFPNAIDIRRQALKLHQDVELKRAQQELAATDSLLQSVQHDMDYQQEKVNRDKQALRATPEELTMLTQTRIRRDSLRTQCEVLGAKIRYIHKKQKEKK